MIEDFKASALRNILLFIMGISVFFFMFYVGIKFRGGVSIYERLLLIFLCLFVILYALKNEIYLLRKCSFKIILSDSCIDSELIIKRKASIQWADINKIIELKSGKQIHIQSLEKKIVISSSLFGDEYEVLKDRLKEKAELFKKPFIELNKK